MNRTLVTILLVAMSLIGKDWQSTFSVDKKTLGVRGTNPFFNLTPGYQLSYAHKKDTETVSVLDETRVIDGVTTRVVEDRELKNGELAELTRDYYAIDTITNDVYYFGEDVDVYKNGKIVDHEGSWMSGLKNAKFGLMMPAKPMPGQRFFQEQAPGVGEGPAGANPLHCLQNLCLLHLEILCGRNTIGCLPRGSHILFAPASSSLSYMFSIGCHSHPAGSVNYRFLPVIVDPPLTS